MGLAEAVHHTCSSSDTPVSCSVGAELLAGKSCVDVSLAADAPQLTDAPDSVVLVSQRGSHTRVSRALEAAAAAAATYSAVAANTKGGGGCLLI